MRDPMQADEDDARLWGSMCHFTALAGYLIPFGNIIIPLVIWRVKGREHPFIDEQGKESLNFQLTMTLYTIVSIILIFAVIGIFFLIALGIVEIILVMIAGIKAHDGISYRYPLTLRLIN